MTKPDLRSSSEKLYSKGRLPTAIGILLCVVTLAACARSGMEPSVPSSGAISSPLSVSQSGANTSDGKIHVVWYIGYGTGSDPIQMQAQQAVAEDFNKSQDKIQLDLDDYEPDHERDQLATMMAYGGGPDIVGPMGWGAANYFRDEWLDLDPLIESGRFDISQFNPALVEMYKSPEGQVGLPFAVYPSAVFYNTKLFDAAGLAYPPAHYGEGYKLPDGLEVAWSWDTLRQVARLLTLDSGGRNSTQHGFNAKDIVQYGFTWQYENHTSYWGSYWAGGSLLTPGGSPGSYKAHVPDAWRASWEWTYDAIWGDQPFLGSAAVESSQDDGVGNPFNSGKVAMTVEPYWYSCCMNDIKTWEAAAIPAYNGKAGGRIDGDTFRIWKGTKNPQAAFEVVAYLVSVGVQKLIIGSKEMPAAYGALPARTANQHDWLEIQKAKFPWVKNWDTVLAGLDYPDIPSAEGYMPNYNEAWMRGSDFAERLRSTGGLDLDEEIEKYLSDLQTIFNQ
jgi:multiple sugar transport system substrate-binding protein